MASVVFLDSQCLGNNKKLKECGRSQLDEVYEHYMNLIVSEERIFLSQFFIFQKYELFGFSLRDFDSYLDPVSFFLCWRISFVGELASLWFLFLCLLCLNS